MTQCVHIDGPKSIHIELDARELDDILGDLCVFLNSWRMSTATVELVGSLRLAQHDIAVTQHNLNTD